MKLPLSHQQLAALAKLRSELPNVRFVLSGAAALGAHLVLPRLTADIDLVLVASPDALLHALPALGQASFTVRLRNA